MINPEIHKINYNNGDVGDYVPLYVLERCRYAEVDTDGNRSQACSKCMCLILVAFILINLIVLLLPHKIGLRTSSS